MKNLLKFWISYAICLKDQQRTNHMRNYGQTGLMSFPVINTRLTILTSCSSCRRTEKVEQTEFLKTSSEKSPFNHWKDTPCDFFSCKAVVSCQKHKWFTSLRLSIFFQTDFCFLVCYTFPSFLTGKVSIQSLSFLNNSQTLFRFEFVRNCWFCLCLATNGKVTWISYWHL